MFGWGTAATGEHEDARSSKGEEDGLDDLFLAPGRGTNGEGGASRRGRPALRPRRHVVVMDAGPGSASDPGSIPVATAVLMAGDGESAAVWGLVQADLVARGFRCIALHGQSAEGLQK